MPNALAGNTDWMHLAVAEHLLKPIPWGTGGEKEQKLQRGTFPKDGMYRAGGTNQWK